MIGFYSGTHHFPPLEEFPDKHRRLAEKSFSEYETSRRKTHEKRGQRIQEITETARRKLRDRLGKKNWLALRKLKESESLAFRDVLQPPKGPGLDYEKVNKARKRRADSFLRGVGMSREQIRAIGGEFGERLKDIMPSEKAERGYCLPKHLGTWKRLSPYHEVSLPWGDIAQVDGSDDPHRWFLYRPPFWGFNFAFDSQATSNFTVSREHILSPPAGLVGHDLRVHANDTNDFDAAHAIADTQVAIGFVPPITGRIAVLIDAVSGEGQHYFSIKENEWGWSTAWTNQMNYLTMHVLHPNVPEPSLALMSSFSHENDEVETIEREYLIPNEHYFAHLVSAGQVPGEQSVVIVVGTRTFHIARADDIRLRTASKFIWYIRSIEVRVVP